MLESNTFLILLATSAFGFPGGNRRTLAAGKVSPHKVGPVSHPKSNPSDRSDMCDLDPTPFTDKE